MPPIPGEKIPPFKTDKMKKKAWLTTKQINGKRQIIDVCLTAKRPEILHAHVLTSEEKKKLWKIEIIPCVITY